MLNFIHSKIFGWNPIIENAYQLDFVFVAESVIKIAQDGGNEIFLAGDRINELVNIQK